MPTPSCPRESHAPNGNMRCLKNELNKTKSTVLCIRIQRCWFFLHRQRNPQKLAPKNPSLRRSATHVPMTEMSLIGFPRNEHCRSEWLLRHKNSRTVATERPKLRAVHGTHWRCVRGASRELRDAKMYTNEAFCLLGYGKVKIELL